MHRTIRLCLCIAAIYGGMMWVPGHGHADASCDVVLADLPVLTDQIQSEWVVQNCSSRTSIRVTLSELRADGWERADCDGFVDNCTIVRPTGSQDCGDGTLFCAYATIHKTETWNQGGGPCSRQWRAKVTVRNPDGDVIAQSISPANTC